MYTSQILDSRFESIVQLPSYQVMRSIRVQGSEDRRQNMMADGAIARWQRPLNWDQKRTRQYSRDPANPLVSTARPMYSQIDVSSKDGCIATEGALQAYCLQGSQSLRALASKQGLDLISARTDTLASGQRG